jgi:sugar phosphate isomerase/epimerase
MHPCFHSVGLPGRSLLEAIDMVAGAGYAAIELNAETLPWAPAHVTPETTAAERKAIVERCRARGLSIPAVGAHIQMVDASAEDRARAIAFVNGCTDLADDVGAPIVHILSGPQVAGATAAESWRWFADAVAATTEHAGRRGVILAIEAIAGHRFHEVDDYHRLAKDLPGVEFRVNFDPSHLEVQGENPGRVVAELADRIVHVHLKDGRGRYPDFSFPPLGMGTIDFVGLVSGLRAAGYEGALSVEYEAQVYGFEESEATILDHGLAFLAGLGVGKAGGSSWPAAEG